MAVLLKEKTHFVTLKRGHDENQIKKVSNETAVDSCSKTYINTVTNDNEESDTSSNKNEITAETLFIGSNNDEKIVAASDLTNAELLSSNHLFSNQNDDEAVFGENEQYIDNNVKDSAKPNTVKEIESSHCITTISSVVKENTNKNINTDHFVCESTNQSTDNEQMLLASQRERSLNENNVKNNEIDNGETQTVVYEITDAIPAALENEPVFESVSEKVKKRKRNASGRQFSEYVSENKKYWKCHESNYGKKVFQ